MGRIAIFIMTAFFALPAFAESSIIEEANRAFAAVEADSDKLDAYCKLIGIDAAGDGSDSAQTDPLMNVLGDDFKAAWDAGSQLDPSSDDYTAYNAAVSQLNAKCGN